MITRREIRVLKDEFPHSGFVAQRGLQNLLEETMKAARRFEPEEGKDVVRECDFMAEIMLGAGPNQDRRQVQQINTGDWGKPEVCIKRMRWEVQRGVESEAAVYLQFDAAGFRVGVNFAEVKRVWFGEETRRNCLMEGRTDFQ